MIHIEMQKKRELYRREMEKLTKDEWRKEGFLYIIQGEEDICKIGKTSNDPILRYRAIDAGNWRKVTLKYVATIYTDYHAIEALIHGLLSSLLIKNEWFNINPADAVKQTELRSYGFAWREYDPYYDYKAIELEFYRRRNDRKRIEEEAYLKEEAIA